MKILIVKPILPYPPTQGTRRVTLNLIDYLRDSHELTLLCKTLNDEEDRLVNELAQRCRVVAVRAPNTRSLFHRVACKGLYCLKSALTLVPLRAQYDCPGVLLEAARGLMASETYDVLLVEYWTMAPVARKSTAKVNVLLEHDFDMIRNRERVRSARGPVSKLRRWLSWRLESRGQLRAYALFDSILTLTDFDREQVQHVLREQGLGRGEGGERAVEVLPTGVDESFFRRADSGVEEGSVLFVGAFAADFNVDAVRFFAEDVFPLVRERVPASRLYIAGGGAPPEVRRLGEAEGIVFLGLQTDLTGPLERAAVFVVPLRFAGGIRIRTLEAMAMGKAIVTTSIGVRGIPAEDGKHLIVADGEEEFAEAVAGLLEDPGRRAQLGAAAREFAWERYSTDAARGGVLALFERLGARAARASDRV